jgi:hypothetical protein
VANLGKSRDARVLYRVRPCSSFPFIRFFQSLSGAQNLTLASALSGVLSPENAIQKAVYDGIVGFPFFAYTL